MYCIMVAKAVRDNFETLYQFMTTTNDNDETVILEIETKEELDKKIESMLNDDGYAKSDFVVAKIIDYTIDVIDYSDEEDDSDTEESDTEESDVTDEDDDSDTEESDVTDKSSDNDESAEE